MKVQIETLGCKVNSVEAESIAELFGKNVKKYRKEAGLTQEHLSERLGISQKHLSIIETGTQFASASLIGRISKELNVSLEYLLTGEEQKSSLSELTENEQTIVRVFKDLTDTQQGEIIGRAKVMAEQNGEEYLRKESVS